MTPDLSLLQVSFRFFWQVQITYLKLKYIYLKKTQYLKYLNMSLSLKFSFQCFLLWSKENWLMLWESLDGSSEKVPSKRISQVNFYLRLQQYKLSSVRGLEYVTTCSILKLSLRNNVIAHILLKIKQNFKC